MNALDGFKASLPPREPGFWLFVVNILASWVIVIAISTFYSPVAGLGFFGLFLLFASSINIDRAWERIKHEKG